jgi:hypothetical protein
LQEGPFDIPSADGIKVFRGLMVPDFRRGDGLAELCKRLVGVRIAIQSWTNTRVKYLVGFLFAIWTMKLLFTNIMTLGDTVWCRPLTEQVFD